MFRLRRLLSDQTAEMCRQWGSKPFSYAELGMTRGEVPLNYIADSREVQLGEGEHVFREACQALREWKMFDLPWVQLLPQNAPIAKGTVVAVLARAAMVWAVGFCRIVYVEETARRFGFAYGTLAHVARGEERFLIEWRPDNRVWYTIRAYSRPGHWLTRVVYPYFRSCQRSFGMGSLKAMQRAVTAELAARSILDKMP